jgi:hypothetical protein
MFQPAVAILRFPQTIKMSLYNLCEGALIKRSLCINPLFALVSSVNRLYINNEEMFSIIPHFLNLDSGLSYGRHTLILGVKTVSLHKSGTQIHGHTALGVQKMPLLVNRLIQTRR